LKNPYGLKGCCSRSHSCLNNQVLSHATIRNFAIIFNRNLFREVTSYHPQTSLSADDPPDPKGSAGCYKCLNGICRYFLHIMLVLLLLKTYLNKTRKTELMKFRFFKIGKIYDLTH